MKRINIYSILLLTVFISPTIAEAVDKTSDSYKTGQYVGYAFGVVLLFLIIKKLLGK